jgi:hypothetical protein
MDQRSLSLQQCKNICIRVYAISSTNVQFILNVAVSIVVETWQQNSVALQVFNNSTAPVHIVAAYIQGPDGVTNFNPFGVCPPPYPIPNGFPCWVSGGQTVFMPLTFNWSTSQNYVATIVTDKGVIVSITVTSP